MSDDIRWWLMVIFLLLGVISLMGMLANINLRKLDERVTMLEQKQKGFKTDIAALIAKHSRKGHNP